MKGLLSGIRMSTAETLWVNRTLGMLARANRLRIVPVWALEPDNTYRLTIVSGSRSAAVTLTAVTIRRACGGDQVPQAELIRTLRELVVSIAPAD
jgi:hypothetical protein